MKTKTPTWYHETFWIHRCALCKSNKTSQLPMSCNRICLDCGEKTSDLTYVETPSLISGWSEIWSPITGD